MPIATHDILKDECDNLATYWVDSDRNDAGGNANTQQASFDDKSTYRFNTGSVRDAANYCQIDTKINYGDLVSSLDNLAISIAFYPDTFTAELGDQFNLFTNIGSENRFGFRLTTTGLELNTVGAGADYALVSDTISTKEWHTYTFYLKIDGNPNIAGNATILCDAYFDGTLLVSDQDVTVPNTSGFATIRLRQNGAVTFIRSYIDKVYVGNSLYTPHYVKMGITGGIGIS